MLAVTAESFSDTDPLSGLVVGERPDPVPPPGWVVVAVRAAALNHHDLWSLRGVGLAAEQLPMILGCDAAGIAPDGREVIVYPLIGDHAAGGGDETMDPDRTILSERYDGTLAEFVAIPADHLIAKPAALSWAEAASLPGAWLTAYRMVFVNSGVLPGGRLLVQGAGGGVSSAAITLAAAGGFEVWATSRDAAKRERALGLGAAAAFEPGAKLPGRVDAVLETVGAATWAHSLRVLRPGGRIVVSGATTGANPPADLTRVFFRQLSVVGSTMGTRDDLARLVRFCELTGVRPTIDSEFPLARSRDAFERLAAGDQFGKIVITV